MTATLSTSPQFSVFYDGGCPLCVREIGFYQRQTGADQINWVDLTSHNDGPVAPGLSCQAALARFHVQTRSGELLQGGTAFAALWRELPKFRRLGQIGGQAPFRWFLNLGYKLFLPLRPSLQWLAGRIWKAPVRTN